MDFDCAPSFKVYGLKEQHVSYENLGDTHTHTYMHWRQSVGLAVSLGFIHEETEGLAVSGKDLHWAAAVSVCVFVCVCDNENSRVWDKDPQKAVFILLFLSHHACVCVCVFMRRQREER